MINVGTRIATHAAKDPPPFRRYSWMGFVTQAGLSIALASQLKDMYPGWGEELATLQIAIITFNQLVGPVLFKAALERVGETLNARRIREKLIRDLAAT